MILVSVFVCFFIGVLLIAISSFVAGVSEKFLVFLLFSSMASGFFYFAFNLFAVSLFPLTETYALLCGYLGVFGLLAVFIMNIIPIL